jgi:hypothetical protein
VRRLLLLGSIVLALAAVLPSSGEAKSLLSFTGDRIGDFWLDQSAPGAITEVPDPAGSGETVFKFTVGDNDETGYSGNPRAELISPDLIGPGDELWARARFLFPRNFPRVPGWLNVLQGPFGDPGSGSPPFSIKVAGNALEWQRNETYQYDVPWAMRLPRGHWVNVLVHTRFADHGFVELWVDGRHVSFFSHSHWNPHRERPTTRLWMSTADDTNYGDHNAMYLQSYRKGGMFPSVTLFQGPLRIGPTRASVRG